MNEIVLTIIAVVIAFILLIIWLIYNSIKEPKYAVERTDLNEEIIER